MVNEGFLLLTVPPGTHQRGEGESCAQDVHRHGELLDNPPVHESDYSANCYNDPGEGLRPALPLKVLQCTGCYRWEPPLIRVLTICVGMSNILEELEFAGDIVYVS